MKSEKTIFTPSASPLSVAVLVLDETNTLSFAAGVDPMRAANRIAGRRLFDWYFVTATGQPALLTSGLSVTGPPLARVDGVEIDRRGPASSSDVEELAGRFRVRFV